MSNSMMPSTPTAVASATVATHAPTCSITGPVSALMFVATVRRMAMISTTIGAAIVTTSPACVADVDATVTARIPVSVGDTVARSVGLGISVAGTNSASREA